jgi:general secretion pathway protein B
MSLILEALRKSEAERRRGEAPDLRVELPPVAAPRPRALPAWVWAAGLALVLLGALAVWWPRGSDADGDLGGEVVSEPVTEGAGDPVTAPSAPDRADLPRAASAGQAFPRVERITPAPPALPSPAPAPQADALPAPRPVLVPAPPAGAARDVPERAAAAAAPALPERATATPSAAGDIPRIAELSSGQRERLPAMKLSMHMWNEDPARRFVVIDGQRRIEGDRVGPATVTAIDRDGVILDLDGQAVRVPLP